jgi:hypothetical protein
MSVAEFERYREQASGWDGAPKQPPRLGRRYHGLGVGQAERRTPRPGVLRDLEEMHRTRIVPRCGIIGVEHIHEARHASLRRHDVSGGVNSTKWRSLFGKYMTSWSWAVGRRV